METIRRHQYVFLIAVLLTGCTQKQAEPLPPSLEPALPAASTSDQATTPSLAAPTATPNPFPNPVLVVNGQEETVFDWTTDRCAPENLPDLASRAFRDAEGQVQLVISHFTNYRMTGPDLDHLTIDCSPILTSVHDPDPSQYTDAQWIAAPYTEDGQTIYALVHNEYQGHTHPGKCPQNDYFPCWDNSLTLAVSTDGGKSYTEVLEPPDHLIARFPYPYQAGAGPEGFRNPSNIIKGEDNYYYSFFNVSNYQAEGQWVCLMRTDDLAAPGSWLFWDGSGFGGQFADPYRDEIADPGANICAPLDIDNIGASLNDSITFNTYLDRYVLVGLSADWLDNREVWGVYYSFSEDLVHWTRRLLLVELPLPWTVDNHNDVMYLYPTLIDSDSESRNFETTDQTAYLYYTRHNFGQGSLDRDLIRVPVEFFPSAEDVVLTPPGDEADGLDPVALNITRNNFSVPANTPIELTLVWETVTADQAAEFLANAQFKFSLDGELLPDVEDYWSEVAASGERFITQLLYPIGILDPGSHLVEIQISLTAPVSDGLGNTYRGTIFSSTLQIEIGS